jgi:hypothetical protein
MVFGMCTPVAPRRRSLAPNLREPLDAGAAGLQVASMGISSAIAPVIEGLAVGYLLAALAAGQNALQSFAKGLLKTGFAELKQIHAQILAARQHMMPQVVSAQSAYLQAEADFKAARGAR